jgi:glycine hydroxymethyltransferase
VAEQGGLTTTGEASTMSTLNWNAWECAPPGAALREADPEIAALVAEETARQNDGLELIASENFVSPPVLEAMGSPLTNKYAEGLPGKRYYGGCEVVDRVEQLAIDRAKELFGAEHANVQPHSGASANFAVFQAFLKPGDTFVGMDLSNGGHLTHGSPVNFSGMIYRAVSYGVTDEGHHRLRADARARARAPPRMVIAGYSAYSRAIDWQAFRDAATRWARCSSSTWRTSPGSPRRACTRRRCRSPTWSRPPRTRRCAGRAAA